MQQSYSKIMLMNRLNIAKIISKSILIKTYKSINKIQIEPNVEIAWEFPNLYLEQNMADMDTRLVMVGNYYHVLNKIHLKYISTSSVSIKDLVL
jgi:hypothetical protein